MPVLHSYVDEDGYYITARPSDVGNITYQTTEEVDQLLLEFGYGDGDDIPWGIINPLRSVGLIYTNNEGIENNQETAPELDPSKLPELTEQEAQELLEYLDSREDVPDNVYNRLKEKIKSSKEELLENIWEKFDSRFPDTFVRIHVTWRSGEERTIQKIEIELTEIGITHYIGMYGDSSIDEWEVEHSYDESWIGMARAYETKPQIMRAFFEINRELPVEFDWVGGHDGGYMI